MPKKFYDSEESKYLAKKKVLPEARALYKDLRLSFSIPDCGLGEVLERDMGTISGYGESLIVDVLLPNLVLHELIHYDDGVVFIPNTALTENCLDKILSKNLYNRPAFFKALKSVERNVSVISNCGGQNLAVVAFITWWINVLDNDIAESTAKLKQVSSDNSKKIAELTDRINDAYEIKGKLYNSYTIKPTQTPNGQPIAQPDQHPHNNPTDNPSKGLQTTR